MGSYDQLRVYVRSEGTVEANDYLDEEYFDEFDKFGMEEDEEREAEGAETQKSEDDQDDDSSSSDGRPEDDLSPSDV